MNHSPGRQNYVEGSGEAQAQSSDVIKVRPIAPHLPQPLLVVRPSAGRRGGGPVSHGVAILDLRIKDSSLPEAVWYFNNQQSLLDNRHSMRH